MSIFDTLLDLPLFKGVSRETMERIVGKFRLDFKKYSPNDTIIKKGKTCRTITFLISGTVECRTELPDGLIMTQEISDKTVFFPDFLFGKSTEAPSTIKAVDNVSTFEISKAEYIGILSTDPVFQFNYFNLLSRRAQAAYEHAPVIINGDFLQRLRCLTDILTNHLGSKIEFTTLREPSMPKLFGIDDSTYTEALTPFRSNGIIDFTSNRITILDRVAFLE